MVFRQNLPHVTCIQDLNVRIAGLSSIVPGAARRMLILKRMECAIMLEAAKAEEEE